MPFANNNGVKIHYEVEGQGLPILVQHGFSGDLRQFTITGVIQELKKNNSVILIDARGCGEIDKPHNPEAYQGNLIASDYISIMDDLKIQKAIYYGYSMGGAIGFQCLARYALSRFNAMILGGSSPYGDILNADKKEFEERLDALRMSIEKGMGYYLDYYEKNISAQLTPLYRDAILVSDPEARLALAAGIAEWPSAADILPTMYIPLFVFGGELDPRIMNMRECVKYLPRVTFLSLPGKTHNGATSDSGLLSHIKKFLIEVGK